MKVTLWGTRGSVSSAGLDTVRYGGNTSCVEVRADDGSLVVLDAGTGLRRLGTTISTPCRIDLLLSHLHMDHIQGLGFFGPFFRPGFEVHVWGPPSPTLDLRHRLTRYLSPPLFPVRLRDLESLVEFHDVPREPFALGPITVTAASIIHPGPTVGYRLDDGRARLAYLPDHEPALGAGNEFPGAPEWTSGHDLAADVDVLIHDAQYTEDEYTFRPGWGHSAISHTMAFAQLARARRLVPFHHDPAHDDSLLDQLHDALRWGADGLDVIPGREGESFEVG